MINFVGVFYFYTMKKTIKIVQATHGMEIGTEKQVPELIANQLVAKGVAEIVTEKKPKKAKEVNE